MNSKLLDLDVDAVVVKYSMRRNLGDLDSLATSIRSLGLLHPVIVDRNNILVVGGRRLEAARRAGLTHVPAMKLDIDFDSMTALDIQSDENLCRLPLTPEELDGHIRRKTTVMGGFWSVLAARIRGFLAKLKFWE